MPQSTNSRIQLLILLAFLHSGFLATGNAAGSKLIAIGPLSASATVFIYALSFLITDIVSELFGRQIANLFVWFGIAIMIIETAIFQLAIWTPPAAFFETQAAYEAVLGVSWRFLVAGVTAYFISQFFDVFIFLYLRKITHFRFLWLRINISSIISLLIDSLIFIVIAFAGTVPHLGPIILGQYAIKVIIALLDTPIIYAVVLGIGYRNSENIISHNDTI